MRTPTDPAQRSPSMLLDTMQASIQALGTKIETLDLFYKKVLTLMDDKVAACEYRNQTIEKENETLRKEVRELRIEMRDLKEGRSRITG